MEAYHYGKKEPKSGKECAPRKDPGTTVGVQHQQHGRHPESVQGTPEFMENGLDAELDEELGYSKYDY